MSGDGITPKVLKALSPTLISTQNPSFSSASMKFQRLLHPPRAICPCWGAPVRPGAASEASLWRRPHLNLESLTACRSPPSFPAFLSTSDPYSPSLSALWSLQAVTLSDVKQLAAEIWSLAATHPRGGAGKLIGKTNNC